QNPSIKTGCLATRLRSREGWLHLLYRAAKVSSTHSRHADADPATRWYTRERLPDVEKRPRRLYADSCHRCPFSHCQNQATVDRENGMWVSGTPRLASDSLSNWSTAAGQVDQSTLVP